MWYNFAITLKVRIAWIMKQGTWAKFGISKENFGQMVKISKSLILNTVIINRRLWSKFRLTYFDAPFAAF